MVRGSTVFLCLVMFACLLAPAVFADRDTEDLQSKVIERFDSPTGDKDVSKYGERQDNRWIVRGSKFLTDGSLKYSWIKTYPNALFPNPTPAEVEDVRVFGVQASFDRKGFNYLEFIPVEDKDGADGKPVEKSIPIPGRVKMLDLWAYGSNLKFYLEAQFKDYRGMVQNVRMGDLKFVGWKNLRVEIPNSFPQDTDQTPARKGLELVKLVMWTYPDENVAGFKFYLDHIKVLSDMFEAPYDGNALVDQKKADDLWKAGVGTVEATKTKTGTTTAATPRPAATPAPGTK